jgi:hypothetical protein
MYELKTIKENIPAELGTILYHSKYYLEARAHIFVQSLGNEPALYLIKHELSKQ